MPRPQKYTDSDISAAIEFIAAAGEDVNPMRVRMRLGGGNVARIKAILDRQSSQLGQTAAAMPRIPDALLKEFQRLSGEVSQQMQLLANKCWAFACNAATSESRSENERIRRRLEKLEADLAASTDLVAQVEAERDEARRDLDLCATERGEFAKECGDIKAALRNAESDLRASQKVIESFEHNQRQDRDEIRQLQKRIEQLVAEVATLKASPSKSVTPRMAANRKKVG